MKHEYYIEIKKQYPEIQFPAHDIHNYTIDDMKKKIAHNLEYARILGAVLKLQRSWRRCWDNKKRWRK